MKIKRTQHALDGLIALVMFSVFAVSILIALIAGANAYARLTQRDRQSYDYRTCMQYIASQIRSNDADSVSVESFGDGNAIVLSDGTYATRIYCYDGYLRELYCAANHTPNPEEGERILRAAHMQLSLDDGLLSVTITADGKENTMRLSLRNEKGGRL